MREVRLADGHDAWLVLGHDEARAALKDPRLSKDMLKALEGDPDVVSGGLPGPAFSRHMLNVDPPDHTRLRRQVARAFMPSRVAQLEPAITEIAGNLLDVLASEDPATPVDLVSDYARPMPFHVIGEVLGIPPSDWASLDAMFQALLRPYEGEPPAEMVTAADAIVSYLTELVEAKSQQPADDLVSILVAACDGEDRLTTQEVLSSLFQLIVAGHDTTTSLVGNSVVALLDHPRQMAALVAEPSLLPGAVEELLRYTAAVPHATFRMATEPVELGGAVIPKGKQVLVCLAGANRDPGHWAAANKLDIVRESMPHLAFGHGPHFCLGAPLARLEARVALSGLLGRFPRLVLATERECLSWGHGDGLVLRGLDSLPVLLNPKPC
ncbi:MAG: cytochrome P450 family protein [Acidimicrobiales bacterium]